MLSPSEAWPGSRDHLNFGKNAAISQKRHNIWTCLQWVTIEWSHFVFYIWSIEWWYCRWPWVTLSHISETTKPISFKFGEMLGIRELTQWFNFRQCHFKVKVIFQGQMTTTSGITPILLVIVGMCMHDYKTICEAVTICFTLVNTHTSTHRDIILTRLLWTAQQRVLFYY